MPVMMWVILIGLVGIPLAILFVILLTLFAYGMWGFYTEWRLRRAVLGEWERMYGLR